MDNTPIACGDTFMLNVRTFMGQPLSRRRRGHRQIASFLFGAVPISNRGVLGWAVPISADSIGSQAYRSGSTSVPGGHDHQGAAHPPAPWFSCAHLKCLQHPSGTIQLNTTNPPSTDTYFRVAWSTKTMSAAVIMSWMSWHRKANSVSTMRYPSMSRACPTATPSTSSGLLLTCHPLDFVFH